MEIETNGIAVRYVSVFSYEFLDRAPKIPVADPTSPPFTAAGGCLRFPGAGS